MFNNQPRPEDVVRLPEIVALLGPYLKAPDLFTCIQVCRLWNHLLTPWLWRSIDDSEHSWPTILRNHKNPESQGDKDADWIRAIFAKYGHHIHELTSQWGVIIEVANTSGTCNHLESLRIGDLSVSMTQDDSIDRNNNNSSNNAGVNGVSVLRYEGPAPDRHRVAAIGPLLSPIFEGILEPHQAEHRTVARQEQDWATTQHFWLLVRQNTQSLFSLRLDVSLYWLCLITNVDFIFDTLASLVNLVNLENDMLPLNPNILLERLPGLLSYRTRLRYLRHDNSLTRSFNQLIYLEIWESVPTLAFFTLLKYLPNLETLRMDSFRGSLDFHPLEGHLILENTPSRLKTLRLHNLLAKFDEQIANHIIPWIPHLTEISLPQLYPATAKALGTHCRKLEVVKQIDSGTTIYQDNINRKPVVNTVGILLQECATLKVFDGIHHTLEASNMLKYPWACRDLETFRCQIIGIPRLTIAEQEFLDSTDDGSQLTDSNSNSDSDSSRNNVARTALFKKKQHSLDVQLQVMDHLAGLTNLTVLDLGYEYRYIGYEYDDLFEHRDLEDAQHKKELEPNWTLKIEGEPTLESLELTLATGLDRLSSLTRLEIFGFEGVNHRIGKQELSWMATAWPKLKVLRGLHEDDIPGIAEDPERTKLRDFMRELRVDVRHATLRPKVKV